MWNIYCLVSKIAEPLNSAHSISLQNTEQVIRGTKIHMLYKECRKENTIAAVAID